jgi:hypothetical protein
MHGLTERASQTLVAARDVDPPGIVGASGIHGEVRSGVIAE